MGVGKGYGMPSSHAQFMGFFATYVILWTLRNCKKTSLLLRLARSFVVLGTAGAVCVSRIYLTYHTVEQVVIGFLIGFGSGLAWYIFFRLLKNIGIIEWILDHPFAQYFWLKDTMIDEGLETEWYSWRASRSRHHKDS